MRVSYICSTSSVYPLGRTLQNFDIFKAQQLGFAAAFINSSFLNVHCLMIAINKYGICAC